MLSFEIRSLEIEHKYSTLEARSFNQLVDIRVTEYDNESQISLSVDEASELFEFLKKFLEGKQV